MTGLPVDTCKKHLDRIIQIVNDQPGCHGYAALWAEATTTS